MRFFGVVLLVLGVFATAVAAWEKEDYEIFDLVSALENAEGKGTTFYSFLNVPPTATTNEIAKAYKQKSKVLHPDKNPGVKGNHERFARLGVISTILRNSASRKRYDFFYKNGVPKWRGTGYYYSRFRPGLGSVFVFLIIISSAFQYLVQRMTYGQDLQRIEKFKREARLAAWGAKLVPHEGKRKVKVPVGQAKMNEDGNIVPGRTIDMVVEGQNVYILEPSGHLEILDASAATKPGVKRTWFIVLALALYRKIVPGKGDDDEIDGPAADLLDRNSEIGDGDDLGVSTYSTTSETPTASGTSTPKEGAGIPTGLASHAATTKAGGKRRKGTKQK